MFTELTRDDIFHLETKSLWLRWPRASDAKHITRFVSFADAAEMTAVIPHPSPSSEAGRFIFSARAQNASGKALVLVLTPKGRVTQAIGLVSVTFSRNGEPELDYILSPSVWGRGFASEAVKAVLSTLFTLTGVKRVLASTRPANIASRRVLEKCGFTYAGTAVAFLEAQGGSQICDRFILERGTWARQSGGRLMAPMVQQQPDLFGSPSGAARGGH
jgi:RimJ/RimL family protein N-acetyltransferase